MMAGVCRLYLICIPLLGILRLSQGFSTPRTSFVLGSAGRVVSHYKTSDDLNTSTLLLSPNGDTLFVGARDAVLSLNVSQPDRITLKKKFHWTPNQKNQQRCDASDPNCANFIRVLQFINDTHVYACGSHVFNPHDTILTADNLTVVRQPQFAKGHCPYNGSERNTALFVDGELYAATTKDYWGKSPVLSRFAYKKEKQNLVLEDLPKLLNEPTFISSSYVPSEGKVLFFFREKGVEYNFMNQPTVSRVAQVCTNDNGGKLILQRRWTSFAKSQLICQLENDMPFNILQDIVMVPPADEKSPDNTLFYGIFTSQWPSASGQSAVCAFTLSEIKAAFSGTYLSYNVKTEHWENQPDTKGKLGKCLWQNASDETLKLVKKNFLTATGVNSAGHKPLLISSEQVYSRITAQKVQDGSGQNYTVLYLLSESGFLHKVVLLENGAHIIEEIQVFRQPQKFKSILLSDLKNEVFIGSSEGVKRMPVYNCTFYTSCEECVLARDPFCGWDAQENACVPVSEMHAHLRQDIERANVSEQCEDLQSDYKSVVREPASVYLHQLVKLPCYSHSSLAKVYWTFSNHSIVPLSLYLTLEDGGLVFSASPDTAVELHCVSEEHGLKQTLAIFSLKLQASPRSASFSALKGSRTEGQSEEVELIPESELKFNLGKDVSVTQPKDYYKEMVAVSFLFAICLCVLAVVGVWLWKRSHRKPDSQELPMHVTD